jgi:hypothetical protein
MRSLLQFLSDFFRRKPRQNETWERNSPWRQGQIIPPDLANRLKLFSPDDPKQRFAVIISHDCDIACGLDDEPVIEIIVGTRIDSPRAEYLNARHVRVLDLEYQCPAGKLFLELVATQKRSVGKLNFVGFQPDRNFVLPDKELRALRSWLAVRYRRTAIPDGLQKLVREIFQDTFKTGDRPQALHKIYIDFEPDTEELPSGEKYELNVVLVYDTQQVGAKEVAELAADQLRVRFKKKYFKNGVWNNVELRQCDVVANTSFTLFDVQLHKEVRFEYLSIRTESTAEPSDE